MKLRRPVAVSALFVSMLLLPLGLSAQTASDEGTVLRPGDAVRITVWRQPELSGEFSVSERGTVMHPLFRDVVVTDIPVDEARARIGSYLRQLESNPQFVVEPLLSVSVGGEVRQPSLYRLPPETTIAQAVAMAGGATDRGRLNRVRLFRDGQEIHIDLTSPTAGLAQSRVRSGDQIFVDRRVSIFRDYIAPAGSITAALVTLINIIIN